MAEELFYKTTIDIDAKAEQVWDALVNPEKTCVYMFGCKTESDWKIGSPLLWRGAADDVIYVSGAIIEFEPEKVFAYSTIDPQSSEGSESVSHLIVKYELTPTTEGTQLKITQGDFNQVTNGQARFEETTQSWGMVLESFKKLF